MVTSLMELMIWIEDMALVCTRGKMDVFTKVNFITINDREQGENISNRFWTFEYFSKLFVIISLSIFIFFLYSFPTTISKSEYRWPDGSIYRGEFATGHRHGEGTYTYSDGSSYTGEWSKGCYHGVGQCVWNDGRTYKGEWKEGKADGYGVEKRCDGSIRHEGMWNQDVPIREQQRQH
mmetsp:Transcript_1814/g.2206  ORF Transcript_1814/g.2206 Transcript_1814/m.2206 type:complete len:178 (+) Transcript_1814:639-1172(+)